LTHSAPHDTLSLMSVRITFRDKGFAVRAGMTVRDAILKCDLQPEAVLSVREGKLITDDIILKEGDHIKLVAVISGGQTWTKT
jgi:sulfur carrier protein ThiS